MFPLHLFILLSRKGTHTQQLHPTVTWLMELLRLCTQCSSAAKTVNFPLVAGARPAEFVHSSCTHRMPTIAQTSAIVTLLMKHHTRNRKLRLRVVVLASDRPPMATWQPGVWSVASCALRSQFRDADQVEGRAAEHEQPIHLRQPAQFHLLQGADLLQPAERFLH
jgi:hypothetical protein